MFPHMHIQTVAGSSLNYLTKSDFDVDKNKGVHEKLLAMVYLCIVLKKCTFKVLSLVF